MKQGLEGRLRKLEREYATAINPQVISISWLTADDIRRGRRPGLYYISEDSVVSEDPNDKISENVEILEDDSEV